MATSLTREDKVLKLVDRHRPGLEIGPSHSPFVRKRDGYNVKIVDHATAADLRKKYERHVVDHESIEEVDFVLRDGRFADQIPAASVDWIIASHVIEHATDCLGFLQECQQVLTPGGILSLVIPDMRGVFDFYRGLTGTGEILSASAQNRGAKIAMHDPGAVFDHFAQAVHLDHYTSWTVDSRSFADRLQYVHTFQEAQDAFKRAQTSGDYVDVHRWRFIPPSFRLTLLELRALGLLHLEEACFFDTDGHEFHISLRKIVGESAALPMDVLDRQRLALLKETQRALIESYSLANYGHSLGQVHGNLGRYLAARCVGYVRALVRRALPHPLRRGLGKNAVFRRLGPLWRNRPNLFK